MIKINLLPGKKERKAGIRKEISVSILSVIGLLLVFSLVQWKINKETEDLLAQISNTKKEIAYYKSLTAEVDKAKDSKKMLENKLTIINNLKKEKASPAIVLDKLSVDKPEKIHLESIKKEGSKLGIEGIALDDETVANFMTNLRKSKMFKNVDLVVSEQLELNKMKLKKFILSCEIVLL
jgi:type IV pilus assembly protein PilN